MKTLTDNINRIDARRIRVKALDKNKNSEIKNLSEELKIGTTLINNDRDSWAIFLEDASSPGKYRYQVFDRRGFSYHSTHDTLEKALSDAYLSGYKTLDPNSLNRLAATEEWRLGTEIQADRDLYNRCAISWDEFIARVKKINQKQ